MLLHYSRRYLLKKGSSRAIGFLFGIGLISVSSYLYIYIYTCTFLSFQDVDSLYFKTSLIKLIIFSVDINSWRSLGYHNNFSNNVYYSFQRHTLDTGCNSKTKFCKKSLLTFFKITLPVQFSGKNTRI